MRDSRLFVEVIEHALRSGTPVRFRAEGSSMHPTIRDGEEITAAPVSIADVVRGDVLVGRHHGRILAHRLVAIAGDGRDRRFELRGDSQPASGVFVSAGDILAQIVAVRRHGRSIALPGGWLIRRAHLTVARTRRTMLQAIDACRSITVRAAPRRS